MVIILLLAGFITLFIVMSVIYKYSQKKEAWALKICCPSCDKELDSHMRKKSWFCEQCGGPNPPCTKCGLPCRQEAEIWARAFHAFSRHNSAKTHFRPHIPLLCRKCRDAWIIETATRSSTPWGSNTAALRDAIISKGDFRAILSHLQVRQTDLNPILQLNTEQAVNKLWDWREHKRCTDDEIMNIDPKAKNQMERCYKPDSDTPHPFFTVEFRALCGHFHLPVTLYRPGLPGCDYHTGGYELRFYRTGVDTFYVYAHSFSSNIPELREND